MGPKPDLPESHGSHRTVGSEVPSERHDPVGRVPLHRHGSGWADCEEVWSAATVVNKGGLVNERKNGLIVTRSDKDVLRPYTVFLGRHGP